MSTFSGEVQRELARLPQSIREQINCRLQNGEEGKQIAERLDALPEVIAVLSAGSTPSQEKHWGKQGIFTKRSQIENVQTCSK